MVSAPEGPRLGDLLQLLVGRPPRSAAHAPGLAGERHPHRWTAAALDVAPATVRSHLRAAAPRLQRHLPGPDQTEALDGTSTSRRSAAYARWRSRCTPAPAAPSWPPCSTPSPAPDCAPVRWRARRPVHPRTAPVRPGGASGGPTVNGATRHCGTALPSRARPPDAGVGAGAKEVAGERPTAGRARVRTAPGRATRHGGWSVALALGSAATERWSAPSGVTRTV